MEFFKNIKNFHELLFSKLEDQYSGIWSGFSLYYKTYGGITSLITSPYLHISILLTLILNPYWTSEARELYWHNITLDVLPNVLGFTLGGYAILLALGDDFFKKSIAEQVEDETSLFMAVNGAFIHFITVQSIAIMLALIGLSWNIKTGVMAFSGVLFLVYALMSAIAAAIAILEMADLFNLITNNNNDKKL